MSNLLEVILDPESKFDANEKQIEITLDQISIPYLIRGNTIAIECDVAMGIHLLRISLIGDATFKIVDFRLNKSSVRSALYLSWTEQDNCKINPGTWLTTVGQTWILPFGNPMSHWLKIAYDKFNSRGPEYQHGQKIFDVCEVFYPEPVDIGPGFPQIVQDFFKYDFDFTVVDKKQDRYQKSLPYIPIDLGEVENQFEGVYKEVLDNYDLLLAMQSTLPQNQYNIAEDPDYADHPWTIHHFRNFDKDTGSLYWNSTIDHLPKLKQLIDQLDVVDPFYCFIGVTPARSYVAPHVDSAFNATAKFEPYMGCTQLYIPLTPNDKSLFKIAGVGLIPNRPVIINNSHCVHSLINDQDCARVALALRVNFDKNLRFYKNQ